MFAIDASTMDQFPVEVRSVLKQIREGGDSTIEDISSGIATNAKSANEVLSPEVVFQILTQLEQINLVSHADSVSGFSGLMLSNTAIDRAKSQYGQSLSNLPSLESMFSAEKLTPVLDSSTAISELGAAEDRKIIENNVPINPLFSSGTVFPYSDLSTSVASTPVASVDPSTLTSPVAKSSSGQTNV
jgi:hypothetical protein